MALIKRENQAETAMAPTWPEERIDHVFRDMLRTMFSGGAMLDRYFEGMTSPMHVEEYIKDGVCTIRAELPGIDPDKDVDIQIAGGMLTMTARREERSEDKRPDRYHSEFRYGEFQRSFTLPTGATEKDVSATYKDGILEIRIPVKGTGPAVTKVPVQYG